MKYNGFLPLSKDEMLANGDYYCDFLLVTGDSYVDHPSFGIAIIARLMESLGYKVVILSQPMSLKDFTDIGRPRYSVFITAGNIDSMVAHYTVAKKKRTDDNYTAGGKAGRRPDRAATVYSKLAREAFGDINITLGGLEASLRRFAHYDYWSDSVLPSILVDSTADMLMFGMAERTIETFLKNFKAGKKGIDLCRDIRGMAYITDDISDVPFKYIETPSFMQVSRDKKIYAQCAKQEYDEQDHARGKAIVQKQDDTRYAVQNPPGIPLEADEMDKIYALPYKRTYHPSYEALGGVPAINEVQFSIIHNRGCFGSCNFCALAFHQGRYISSRSHKSVLGEAEQIAKHPAFKGYIHDVGGPTANFRAPACSKQTKYGLCKDKKCLAPGVCDKADTSHNDYLTLLRKLREVKGVKKVFVRSGIRYDFMLADKNNEFFNELVKHHVSGQLKVAPEHISDTVLEYMGKPTFTVYEEFRHKYEAINEKIGKKQYLVPYLMSSHPGCTIHDAIQLTQYLKKINHMPEQVQDFYPTPGTLSTAMYYTGIDPRTGKDVYVPKTKQEKEMQRALLQWRRPYNRNLVLKALKSAGREDLIGSGKDCIIAGNTAPRKININQNNPKNGRAKTNKPRNIKKPRI